MGNTEAHIEIGPKSLRSEAVESTDIEIDYKDPKNDKKAKKELYGLFLEDKVVHISKVEEVMDKLDRLQDENKRLKDELENYKKLNMPSRLEEKSIEREKDESEGEKEEVEGEKPEKLKEDKNRRKGEDPDLDLEVQTDQEDNSSKRRKSSESSLKPSKQHSRYKTSISTEKSDENAQIRISRIADKIKAAQKRLRKARSKSAF